VSGRWGRGGRGCRRSAGCLWGFRGGGLGDREGFRGRVDSRSWGGGGVVRVWALCGLRCLRRGGREREGSAGVARLGLGRASTIYEARDINVA